MINNINDEYYLALLYGGDGDMTYSVKGVSPDNLRRIVNFDNYAHIAKPHPEYDDLSWHLSSTEPMKPFDKPIELISAGHFKGDTHGLARENGDCYELAGGYMVVSQRLRQIIERSNAAKIDFITANITLRDRIYTNYFILHIRNRIECMDMSNSIYEESAKGGVLSIESLRLDREKLEKIPLEERLIFELDESPYYKLFHKSIVDEIQGIKIKSFNFRQVSVYEEE